MKKIITLAFLVAMVLNVQTQNNPVFRASQQKSPISETLQKTLLDPPSNLTGYLNGDDLLLTWDAPGGSSGNGEWIHWDTGENNGNGIGLAGGDFFYVASRWTPFELAPFDGMEVTKMSFLPNGDENASYTLKIWIGENNACTEIMSQEVPLFTINEFNIVDLDNVVEIDATMEYWIGYRVFNNLGFFPAGCDDGPAIQESGDMFSMDGINWEGISAGYGLDYNWNLAAYVDYPENAAHPKPVTRSNPNSPNLSMGISTNQTKAFYPASTKDLLGYIVYMNGDSIAFTTETSYTIEDIEPGTFEFCITAIYDEGESECSNTFTIVGPLPLLPPTNFTGPDEAILGEQFCFTWDTPGEDVWIKNSEDLLFFNLYRNGDLIGNTDCDIIYSPGVYTYCVTAVYDEGESVCSNDWIIDLGVGVNENQFNNIRIFPNPATEIVNIKSDIKIENIKMYNYSGQIILDKKANNNFYEINTSQFEAGIYFFRIETEEGVVSKRIVVQ